MTATDYVTDVKPFLNDERDTELFDAEWKTPDKWFETSEFPDEGSHCNASHPRGLHTKNTDTIDTRYNKTFEREEETDVASDWVASLGSDDEFDIVITTSSLTEGSDFSFGSEFDTRHADIIDLSIQSSDEEDTVRSNHDDDDDNMNSVQRESYYNEFDGKISKPPHWNRKGNTRSQSATATIPAEAAMGLRRGSISYAQLFFDPETKALVTLMEIMNDSGPIGAGGPGRRSKSNPRGGWSFAQRKNRDRHRRGRPLDRTSLEQLNNNYNDICETVSCSSNTSTKGSKKERKSCDDWDEDNPFQDETLSTEYSSLSSGTYHHQDDGNGDDNDVDDDDDWALRVMKSAYDSPEGRVRTRFSDEPIVFSNDKNMGQKLCWLEEAEVDLYLLHDCDDPWDYGSTKGSTNTRCGDSLMRLLKVSRLCISLSQIGELKWRASTTSDHYSNLTNGSNKNQKVKPERSSYSVLNN